MTLSERAIKNPVFAWMLMLGLILFGSISFTNLGLSEMPDIDFPVVNISVNYRGAAPEIMESDVIDLIEESVMTVEGIKNISSSSKQDSGRVTIEFELDRNIDQAVQDVQSKISQIQKNLPDEIDPPIVTKMNPEDQPIMWVSLSANIPARDLMKYARDQIKDKLQTTEGVAEVMLSGYVEPTLNIWLDPNKLDEHELTVQDILSSLETGHIEIPVGRLETNEKEYNLRYIGEALSPDEFSDILITQRGGKQIFTPIRLGEVAKIESGLDEIRRISRVDGKPSLGLGIKKQRGANAVQVADNIKKKLDQINKNLPEGYSMQVNFDATTYIRHAIDEMEFELFLSALLTGIVCFVFLASFSSTFNILLAIPTSIVGSFLFMDFFGFTLNNFTLLSLTLAIGIVVDDAIMMLENIVRHQEMGKPKLLAARIGSNEITSAAVATTVAIVAIFAPIIFMKGIIGKFLYQFGVVLSVAVLLSLLEAITLTPMRCSTMNLVHHNRGRWAKLTDRLFQSLANQYKNILAICLRYKWSVLILSTVLFIASLFVFPSLRKEFVPSQDQSIYLVNIQTPLGSSITFTDNKVKEFELILEKHKEIKRYFLAIGGFSGGEVNSAIVFLSLKDPDDRPIDPKTGKRPSANDVAATLREEFKVIKDATVIFQDMSMRGFTAQRGFPIEFSIRGPDWQNLTSHAESIIAKMKSNDLYRDVDTDYRYGQPEIQITPDRDAAAKYGVKIADIGNVIGALIGGIRQGRFTEEGHRNEIRVQLPDVLRSKQEIIKTLFVRNNQGELVSLEKLVNIKQVDTLQSITRRDRQRAVSIYANIGEGKSQQEALNAITQISKDILPVGYSVVFSGSSETFKESFQSLFIALILGVIVAYMVLGSQYNSFLDPLSVLIALPFSLSGALLSLWLGDLSLNIYSFIGVIMLMGIAKKNSIMLVDFTNQNRKEGLSTVDALLSACPKRLRPILMTSITILAAALPSAMAFGPGSEVRRPMSAVIIGGILVSTILSLFVVPCVYLILTRFEKRRKIDFDD